MEQNNVVGHIKPGVEQEPEKLWAEEYDSLYHPETAAADPVHEDTGDLNLSDARSPENESCRRESESLPNESQAIRIPDTPLNRAIVGLLNLWSNMRERNKFHTGKIQAGMTELAITFFTEHGMVEQPEESPIIVPDNSIILPR